MVKKGQSIIEPVVDLVVGLWRRADRDFAKKGARDAFRETCSAVLRGEIPEEVVVPSESTPRDSAEWAQYVAYCDCAGLRTMLESMSDMVSDDSGQILLQGGDESDSDADSFEGFLPLPYRIKRRKPRMLNPATDKRFKVNKTAAQIEQMQKRLEQARVKATEVLDANRGVVPAQEQQDSITESDGSSSPDDSSTVPSDESSDIEYLAKRPKNSRPKKVPLPPLPMDYRMENEWIKNNIKSPDMLYSYVRMKSGDGIRWSSGMRKYFESNDFWEFAFDTLSCGGWHDSEHNRPICNVSKYITKVTIEEYSRHEATKHSRFEGRFKTGRELLDYIQLSCSGMRDELKTEEYCSWFLQKMNDCGWRWNNGSTINNIPGMMSQMYKDFTAWCEKNDQNLTGLNPSQYGETLRIQNAIERGDWKPRENGKFCAMDLLKLAKPQS